MTIGERVLELKRKNKEKQEKEASVLYNNVQKPSKNFRKRIQNY